MATTTKKDLIDRIADETNQKRTVVQRTVQSFLDNVIRELRDGHRLEFRDFGVFEIRKRAARIAQNPKTLERVPVPPKKTVKFKVGRLMKAALEGELVSFELDLDSLDGDASGVQLDGQAG